LYAGRISDDIRNCEDLELLPDIYDTKAECEVACERRRRETSSETVQRRLHSWKRRLSQSETIDDVPPPISDGTHVVIMKREFNDKHIKATVKKYLGTEVIPKDKTVKLIHVQTKEKVGYTNGKAVIGIGSHNKVISNDGRIYRCTDIVSVADLTIQLYELIVSRFQNQVSYDDMSLEHAFLQGACDDLVFTKCLNLLKTHTITVARYLLRHRQSSSLKFSRLFRNQINTVKEYKLYRLSQTARHEIIVSKYLKSQPEFVHRTEVKKYTTVTGIKLLKNRTYEKYIVYKLWLSIMNAFMGNTSNWDDLKKNVKVDNARFDIALANMCRHKLILIWIYFRNLQRHETLTFSLLNTAAL
jgi:hypothetical protein